LFRILEVAFQTASNQHRSPTMTTMTTIIEEEHSIPEPRFEFIQIVSDVS